MKMNKIQNKNSRKYSILVRTSTANVFYALCKSFSPIDSIDFWLYFSLVEKIGLSDISDLYNKPSASS